jgi:hypothetical protein
MTVKEMRKYGLEVNGEAPSYRMPASLAFGPKIGAFYANLNKNFNPLVQDLWFNRSMNRMTGNMFSFSEGAFRKHAQVVKDQIASGAIDMPEAQATKITSQIDRLLQSPSITRNAVLTKAPTLVDWADGQHRVYAKSSGLTRTYGDKTPVNTNAKSLDENLHKTQDTPRGPTERSHNRDVMERVKQNLLDAGVPLTTADGQSNLWYSEQQLFKKAGALKKSSDSSDYLDAAVALAKRYGDDRPQDIAPDASKKAIRIIMPKKAKTSMPAHVRGRHGCLPPD